MAAGRHSMENSVPELRAQIGEIIFDLNGQISALTSVKQDTRTIASKILMLKTKDLDVVVAGGSLMNNLPDAIDEIITGLRIHMRNLEHYQGRL